MSCFLTLVAGQGLMLSNKLLRRQILLIQQLPSATQGKMSIEIVLSTILLRMHTEFWISEFEFN